MLTLRSLFFVITLCGGLALGQGDVIYENNFDQHSEGLYTEAQLEADWNAPPWDDGVREGRVTIVEGAAAFGGSGSSMAVSYPAGEHGTKETGAQWKLFLNDEYEELFVSYRVKFRNGFDFVRGGKLPGLAGGTAPSGSAPADGVNGWTGRLMWRTDFGGTSGNPIQSTSDGISYAKHLDSGFDRDGRQEDRVYWLEPSGERTTLESGVWYQITQRIVMNTPGQADGVLQIWLDDFLVLDQTDLRFRSVADLKIDQLFFSTFFGGGSSWRTSKDEVVYFDDFVISVPADPTPPAEPRFLKVPSEAYATIQEALDDANDGDTVAVRGTHVVNIVVDKAIFFRGYSSTILEAANANEPAITVAVDDATVKRFQIEGGSHAVLVESGYSNILIDNIESRDTDRGLVIEPGCADVVVRSSDFTDSDGDGVFVSGCTDIQLSKVESVGNDGFGFVLQGNINLDVVRCRAVKNCLDGFVISGDGVNLRESLADSNDGAGFVITSGDHDIVDNEARKNKLAGFEFNQSSGNYITENWSRFNDGDGFAWSECEDNVVFDNVGQNNDGQGFALVSCSEMMLESNFADENGLSGFFFDVGTSGSVITNNRSNENDSFGFLDEGDSNQLVGNAARDNGDGDFQ